MRSINVLRSIIFSIGAIFLIFYQDHSVGTGLAVLQFVTVGLVFGGLVLHKFARTRISFREFAAPTFLALAVAVLTLLVASGVDELFVFRTLLVLFAVGMAVIEFGLSFRANPEDVLELRIAAGLGLLTGLVFSLAPLDGLNAVGFFSAYLAISAAQRAVWAASPNNRKKKDNG